MVPLAALPVAFEQGRLDRCHMGGVAADEVRAEEGPRRGQPRVARRRFGASRDILSPLSFFFLPFEILVCSLMWCGLLSVGFWALDLTLART